MAAVDRLCARVLGTTADELSPATRRLLEALAGFVAGRGRPSFTRRELRDATGLGDSQLKVHLARLVDLEYVIMDRAGPATAYELARRRATAYDPIGRVPDGDRPVRRRSAGYRPVRSRARPVGYRPAVGSQETKNNLSTGRTRSSVPIGRPSGRFAGQEATKTAS